MKEDKVLQIRGGKKIETSEVTEFCNEYLDFSINLITPPAFIYFAAIEADTDPYKIMDGLKEVYYHHLENEITKPDDIKLQFELMYERIIIIFSTDTVSKLQWKAFFNKLNPDITNILRNVIMGWYDNEN